MRMGSDRPGAARRVRRGRPAVERLEGRSLPSGFGGQFALGVVPTGASVPNGLVDVEADGVAADASGNLFMTGSLAGKANFSTPTSPTVLTSGPGRDAFVAKYAKTGALLWAKDLPGADASSVAQGSAAAADPAGDVVVTGTFTGTVNFDPNGGTTRLSAPGRDDAFVAKYDAGGNLLWAVDMPGTAGSADGGDSVAVDPAGNVAVAGSYSGSETFGSKTLTAGGQSEAFVAKLGPAGNVLWAASTAGSGSSQATSAGVAFDGSGNVNSTGSFSGTVDFDPGSNVKDLTSAGSRDAFVQKLDASGNLVWASGFGGPDVDQGDGIAADASGNVYVAGSFSDAVDFDPGPAVHDLNAAGLEDGFLLKLNAQGGYAWAVDLASKTGGAVAAGVGVDAYGRAFVAGDYWGSLAPDPSNPSTAFPSVNGSFDAFAAGYDPNGRYLTGTTFGGPDFDAASAVGVGPGGQVAVAGRYADAPAVLGTTLPNAPTRGVFLAGLLAGTPPPAPPAPVLEASSDTGLSATDGITRATSPVFDVSGVAAATDVVSLLRDGAVVAQRTGPGAVTDPGPVPDGTHAYAVTQADGFGDISPASPATTVTVDTRTPATPSAPALDPLDDSGTLGDDVTNVNTPRLVGKADPDVLVQILDASGNVLASSSTAADGSYTVALTGPLADGSASLRAREEDVAGNLSPASPALALVIDTTPPATPPVPSLLAADDSGTAGDGVTNVNQPRLTGTAEPNANVRLLDAAGNVLGAGAAGADGRYTVRVGSPLKDGTYLVRAQATDAAGNASAPGPAFTLVIDTTPPARPSAPALDPLDDSGTAGDGITNVNTPRLVGKADPNVLMQILDASGNVLASSSTAADGSYTVALTGPLADGSASLRAREEDVAGNLSPASPALALVIDTTPPARPTAPALLAADDSGTVGDGVTNVDPPRFNGTAEAGSLVELLDPKGDVVGSASATGQGGYTVAPSQRLADGPYAFTVVAVDAAGNASAPSPPGSLTILTTPPPAPASLALLALDDSGIPGDDLTNVNRPRLTGTATPGLTVLLVNGAGAVLGSAAVGGNGAYTVQPTAAFADGTYALRTKVEDVAGNLSPAGPLLTLTIDATPPAAPAAPALLAADDTAPVGDGKTSVRRPRLVGTTTPGFTVDLLNASGVVVAATNASPAGAYTLQPPSNLAAGPASFAVRVHDAAGNVSAAGPALALTIVDVTPGDFDGDGKTDLAIFRAATAQWIVRPSGGGATTTTTYGATNLFDVPVPGDYDGTGREEYAVFRPSTSQWIIKGPDGTRTIRFGAPNLFDVPVPGDYDGVGYTEPAVFRPSTSQWFVLGPNGSHLLATFGAPNLFDVPVPGDYDGVGRTEPAVFRPSTAQWFVDGPSGPRLLTTFGATGLFDVPAPGDYDGVGRTEPAVFRPSTAQWFVKGPSGSHLLATYGATGLSDLPVDGPSASAAALGLTGGVRMASLTVPAPAVLVRAPAPAASATATVVPTGLNAWFIRVRPNQ